MHLLDTLATCTHCLSVQAKCIMCVCKNNYTGHYTPPSLPNSAMTGNVADGKRKRYVCMYKFIKITVSIMIVDNNFT